MNEEEYVEVEGEAYEMRNQFLNAVLALLFIGYLVFVGVLAWQVDSNTHKILERIEQGTVINP